MTSPVSPVSDPVSIAVSVAVSPVSVEPLSFVFWPESSCEVFPLQAKIANKTRGFSELEVSA